MPSAQYVPVVQGGACRASGQRICVHARREGAALLRQ